MPLSLPVETAIFVLLDRCNAVTSRVGSPDHSLCLWPHQEIQDGPCKTDTHLRPQHTGWVWVKEANVLKNS